MPDYYETDRLLSEYLLMHFGSDEDLMPWSFGPAEAIGFPVRTCGHFPEKSNHTRALDLGCAVGRSAFELSKTCDEVVGIDFSHSFIDAAEKLRSEKTIGYTILETGSETRTAAATLPANCHPERVRFQQGDAMNLPDDLGKFDRIHAANLICRLPKPEKLLNRLSSLLSPGGHLVLATPCTWLNEFTPPESQPDSDTFSWLKSKLDGDFEILSRHDEPFLIRETARKYQWTVSLVTVWEKK
ncbi:MAG: putative 4-mercaptohistidine N1-methyltransferase [Akkermansiaceae bacterium]